MNEELPPVEVFRNELMNTCLRYSQESDLSVYEMLGILRFIEQDLINAVNAEPEQNRAEEEWGDE